MANKTNTGLVSFAQAAATAGWGYVFGTFGQLCDVSLLDQQAARFPDGNLAGGRMRTVGNKWIGQRVCDCSGIIKAFFWMDDINSAPQYNAQQDGILANIYSNATERGPISSLPEIPGLALQLPGHVGVYIGNGEVIEAKGTEYGVIKSKLSDNRWQTWAKIPGVEYEAQPVPAPVPVPTPTPAAAKSNIVAIGTVVGIDADSCLNFRSSPNGDKIGEFHNGDKLNILRWDVSDWYQVECNGTVGWVASVYVAAQPVDAAPAPSPAPAAPVGIAVGSKVKITGTQYANGIGVPDWVRNNTHTVSQISGDRALLGNPNGINSWVKLADLEVVI